MLTVPQLVNGGAQSGPDFPDEPAAALGGRLHTLDESAEEHGNQIIDDIRGCQNIFGYFKIIESIRPREAYRLTMKILEIRKEIF